MFKTDINGAKNLLFHAVRTVALNEMEQDNGVARINSSQEEKKSLLPGLGK